MHDFMTITPELEVLTELCKKNSTIDPADYVKYEVNRGLRDVRGNGVLTGLTEISEIHSREMIDGVMTPCAGSLFYRGYNVEELCASFTKEGHFGFEETTFLLMFGELPTKKQLADFQQLLGTYRVLPSNFVRDVLMKAPSKDVMNSMARGILSMAGYDEKYDDNDLPNVIRQCVDLISIMPLLAVYSYQAYSYSEGCSLYIHAPDPSLSTAENILLLLRPDGQYTDLEARILDLCLVLHAEHGGGNNSTFTTHVVTSSGTDTYSCIAAALASLKGAKHGGANIKVTNMFADLMQKVSNWEDEEALAEYLRGLLHKKNFDKTGLIYGIGHAIYSVSDPRARLLEQYVETLSKAKGREAEYHLYSTVRRLAPEIIAEERNMYKGVSANIDFFSGFMYSMLDIPTELYTPLFAIARISGWSAHRLEELINMSKIIRPAYKAVQDRREFVPIQDR